LTVTAQDETIYVPKSKALKGRNLIDTLMLRKFLVEGVYYNECYCNNSKYIIHKGDPREP
jgi:hypothetical protein